MSHYFLISLYHNTKLRPSDKISKIHTRLKFQILLSSKSKVPAFFVVFLGIEDYRGFSRRGTHPVRAPSRASCWIFLEQQNML